MHTPTMGLLLITQSLQCDFTCTPWSLQLIFLYKIPFSQLPYILGRQRRSSLLDSSPPTKKSWHRPPSPGGHYAELDPFSVLAPVKVVTALEKGMKIYIPFTILTKKACHDARTAAVDKESRHVVKVEEGSLQVHVSKFDCNSEELISIKDWRDASSHYVTLLHNHLWGSGRKAQGWAKAWPLMAF